MDIKRFYGSQNLNEKLEICERLTAVVLSPIGELWCEGELLAFGTTDNVVGLQAKGHDMYYRLLGAKEVD